MKPLVTCITPITESRRHYVDNVNKIIASQDYPNIEHIYVWEDGSIGSKRNTACELAKGEIILHVDSDDYYSPDWVSKQVELLLYTSCDVCGLSDLYFYDDDKKEAWKYIWNTEEGSWVAGATLCYRKSFWQSNKFRDIDTGEDYYFVMKEGIKIESLDYINGFVAMLHGDNTAPHNKSYRWNKCNIDSVLKILIP